MQGLREIKRRIRSVSNTQQITKAMKMVAAARLRRAQEQVQSSRPYATKMREIFFSILEQSGEINHPLFVDRGSGRTLYIVLTAEGGLCGAFNANIMKKAFTTVEEHQTKRKEAQERLLAAAQAEAEENGNTEVVAPTASKIALDDDAIWIPVGRKGRDFLAFRGINMVREFINITHVPVPHLAEEIASEAVTLFEQGEVDEVYVIYSRFISVMHQRPEVFKLLPLVKPEFEEMSATEKAAVDIQHAEYIDRWLPEYIYEPSPELVLNFLIPKYLETIIFHALQETKAGEFGARMTAMDNATKNAGEVINKLNLRYNQARQASITQELLEIVSGAEALK